jgi:hypothetical protein
MNIRAEWLFLDNVERYINSKDSSTVAVSKEVHAEIHRLCKRDDLKVKAVVNDALKEYLKGKV